MNKKKSYNVEVFFKGEQKPVYTWILSACGAGYAEIQATDILSGMTHREITGGTITINQLVMTWQCVCSRSRQE